MTDKCQWTEIKNGDEHVLFGSGIPPTDALLPKEEK